jgi:hypothetical protein
MNAKNKHGVRRSDFFIGTGFRFSLHFTVKGMQGYNNVPGAGPDVPEPAGLVLKEQKEKQRFGNLNPALPG